MISPTVLGLFDFFLLAAILLFAFEALRVTHFKAEPLCAVAFALITIGSFGWAINDLYGIVAPPYAIMLHAGLAVHIALLYRKQRALATQRRRVTDFPVTVPGRSMRSDLRGQVKSNP
jgi:hypothetical protein